MAKQQTLQQDQTELTPRGAKLAEREAAIKELGLTQNYGKYDRVVTSRVRDANLRLRAQTRRVKPGMPLPFQHVRVVPCYTAYYEEQPSADGIEQMRIQRSKQEARGARFTLRRQAVGDGGALVSEKVPIRIPLDGSGNSWSGPHIDEFGAEGEELLIRAILADPNWCPVRGNSGYYIVIVTDDELEALGEMQADEEYEIAEARRAAAVESARQGLAVAVTGSREQVSGIDTVQREVMEGGYSKK